MITTEQLKDLSKDELILYNTLLEKDIKDVAYYACVKVQSIKRLDKFAYQKTMKIDELRKEITELNKKLSRFIGYKNS